MAKFNHGYRCVAKDKDGNNVKQVFVAGDTVPSFLTSDSKVMESLYANNVVTRPKAKSDDEADGGKSEDDGGGKK